MINQRVARAFVRVHRPGALTFAAISEVGVGGRRVDGGHRLNSQSVSEAVTLHWEPNSIHVHQSAEVTLEQRHEQRARLLIAYNLFARAARAAPHSAA